MIRRIPWTLEELDSDGCSVNGAELIIVCETDPGQPLILAADPNDSQEGIEASCEINEIEIVSVTRFEGEAVIITNGPQHIEAVRQWLDWRKFETCEVVLANLLEQISDHECDAAEAAAEDEYERRRG